jgi:uncharacterized membrane protein
MSAPLHISLSIVSGVILAALVSSFVGWQYTPLLAWDFTGVAFLFFAWTGLHNLIGEQTSSLAIVEDPGRAITDVLLVLASIASLVAVGILLFQAANLTRAIRLMQVALGTISVIISWLLVHTIYILKYARLYYKNKGGIEFYSEELPSYSDFAYVAFTIGMTFQISDNNFKTSELRKTALRHAMLSYLFGTVILASIISFILGLGK